ncbi:hypothetical protein CC86DRAFT_408175 [Ophiobolus disseminans]|uniref:BTB domain-containing protein n=1 Tax=Ophiobolus disseminans TaxID=1469910 RepID=A0A6A6ZWE2_9PLEO|nr:hypothetical protein CC86DRAFT_408175 [Ophiobolus disseminans]
MAAPISSSQAMPLGKVLTKNDFSRLSQIERQTFFNSPAVNLVLRDRTFPSIPRSLLHAFPGFFRRKFQTEHSNLIMLPEELCEHAVEYVLNYLMDCCSPKGFSPTKPAVSLSTDAAIYQVCQVFEKPAFSGTFFAAILEVPEQSLALSELEEVLAFIGSKDRLYAMIAERVANKRFRAMPDDKEVLEEWLDAHPEFKEKVEKTREFHIGAEASRGVLGKKMSGWASILY